MNKIIINSYCSSGDSAELMRILKTIDDFDLKTNRKFKFENLKTIFEGKYFEENRTKVKKKIYIY